MSRRLRVAVLKSRRLPGDLSEAHDGGGVHIVKELEALGANGHEVDVFTRILPGADPSPLVVQPGFRVWRAPFTAHSSQDLFIRDLMEGRSFVEGVLASPGFAAANYDVLHIHHWTSGVDIDERLPRALPIVFTPHLLASEKAVSNGLVLPDSVARVERALLQRSTLTVAMSTAEERSCLSLGAPRVERIPSGVSEAFFDVPMAKLGDRPIKLGCVGRVCVQKGFDVLLDAMERLVDDGVDVQLDVVGPSYDEDAYERRLRLRLESSTLSGRVRMVGAVAHYALPALMSTWDVYIQPSRYESQGIALLEAMAARRAIVATALPAVREFLDEEAANLVSTPPDGEVVARAVMAALERSDSEAVRERARLKARAFSWPVTSRALLRTLHSVVERAERTRPEQASADDWTKAARSLAHNVLGASPNAGVMVAGSVARGEAKPGSDIDLLVLVETDRPIIQEWTFTAGTPQDIRRISISHLLRLDEMPDEEFARNYELVDFLIGAVPLSDLRADAARVIGAVRNRRQTQTMRAIIGRQLQAEAMRLFEETTRLAAQDLPADAQLQASAAAQLLLQASMIDRGWLTHGAKRRLEMAATLARDSEAVTRATTLLSWAVGVNPATFDRARSLLSARDKLRAAHLGCLTRLGAPSGEIATAARHASLHTDYYSAAIEDGYIKGCLNHLKAISGVPLMPQTYARLLELDLASPAEAFLGSTAVSGDVKELWLTVIEPHKSRELIEIARAGIALAGVGF